MWNRPYHLPLLGLVSQRSFAQATALPCVQAESSSRNKSSKKAAILRGVGTELAQMNRLPFRLLSLVESNTRLVLGRLPLLWWYSCCNGLWQTQLKPSLPCSWKWAGCVRYGGDGCWPIFPILLYSRMCSMPTSSQDTQLLVDSSLSWTTSTSSSSTRYRKGYVFTSAPA